METKAVCPKCKSAAQVVPIAYGRPGPSLIEEAKQGKVHLGGCSPSDEGHYCNACKSAFK